MTLNEIKTQISQGKLDKSFSLLYKDTAESQKRYLSACDSFCATFGEMEDIRLFSAPGRTEIGGNHTDHQHGRVLAGAVDMDVIAVASKNSDNIIRIESEGYGTDIIDLADISYKKELEGTSLSLVRGICAFFKEKGYSVGGFNAYTTSNVLKGSGLSSSAAFEVLICTILNCLYNDSKLSSMEVALISQRAEREYFGKPCGLLDQCACSFGGFTAMDFADPAAPKAEKVDFDLSASGYTLCVVNTGGNHADLTQDYADITLDCKAVANYFGKDFLRDVSFEEFKKSLPELKGKVCDRAILRALHFFNEDARAGLQKDLLKEKDFEGFLKLVKASGDSSYRFLQNVYSATNSAEQGITLAIALTEEILGDGGVCRVHGGGFAGTIQCYVKNECFENYKAEIEAVFGSDSCIPLKIRSVGGYEVK
jgi:galactokinase